MAIPELVNDLVDEILCRVPATSMKRLRSTSKRWNRLFKDDRRFVREHCDKAAKEFRALMLTKELGISPMSVRGDVPPFVEVKRALSLPDPDPHFNNSRQFDIAQVSHCDGLLLCTPRYGSQIVVWNPFTGQARWIEAEGHHFVLGYSQDKKKSSSCRKSYKVLNFSRGTNNSEIYDFDSDSWRLVDHDIAPGWTIDYSNCRSVSFKGNIYWIAKEGQGRPISDRTIYLLRFDFSTERSQRLPLPYQSRLDYVAASLSAVREDKLSVLFQLGVRSKTEIWVTNKIDDDSSQAISWTKLLALDVSFDRQLSEFGSFLLDEEKKFVVWFETWLNLNVDFGVDKISMFGEDNDLKVIDVGVDKDMECWPVIFNYVPSLFQVERAQIKRAGCKRKRGEC
ncbi:PREDICTED: F-box protein ETP2-like [Camelina sativa]|uniref:F-box protein ETP2-like n=1 Tax=Camelina sativa TaxID=90675 RepID=A0ABM0W5E5_CAMSA|nr:PREDICTED: F-box protein ETP2-like [Camelina sativa]